MQPGMNLLVVVGNVTTVLIPTIMTGQVAGYVGVCNVFVGNGERRGCGD